MEHFNFWDSEVWGVFNLLAVLMGSLLAANSLKKLIPALKRSLIPSSVLGGLLLLIAAVIYESITGDNLFNTSFFGGNGAGVLEVITYHGLALGFIATTLKPSGSKFDKHRSREIFDTGVTTVATYLLQGILGLGITVIAALIAKEAKGKAERKALADSIKDAYSNYVSLREANKKSEVESYNKYLKLRNEFVDKYGSYHLTLTQKDDLKPTISVGVDSIRDLINSCFGSDFWSF